MTSEVLDLSMYVCMYTSINKRICGPVSRNLKIWMALAAVRWVLIFSEAGSRENDNPIEETKGTFLLLSRSVPSVITPQSLERHGTLKNDECIVKMKPLYFC